MRRSIATASLVLAVAMAAGISLVPVTLMHVSSEGGTLACERVSPASGITLAFTHSMYGGDVSTTYRPNRNGTLERVSIVTDNAAAAEYYAWTGEVERAGSGFQVVAPDIAFPQLRFMIDHIGNHRLTVDGNRFNLAALVTGPTPATLGIVRRPLITQVFGTAC